MALRVFSNINNSVILRIGLWTCSVVTQPLHPGWPYRSSTWMGLGWEGIRLKRDQAGWAPSCEWPGRRNDQGQEAAGTHWKQCCGGLAKEGWAQVPVAVCPQRLIRTDGVTSCLRSPCCPHMDTHWALCSISNWSIKAVIYQDGLSCACLGCPWQRVLQVLFLLMSDTLNLCCTDVTQGPARYAHTMENH